MRLIDLEIQNMRGIRSLKLHPGGRNMIVLGPNGSGKSAVVDAVDFLLTGDISRLRGKGSAGMTLKKHGHHIDAGIQDAWVKARVNIDGEEFEIARYLSKEKDLICPAPYCTSMSQISNLARLGHHVLTRREILRFVTAENKYRAQEIQALLNIQEIDEIRLAVNAAAVTFEVELKSRKREEEQARAAVCSALGVTEFRIQPAIQIINRWRQILNGDPVEYAAPGDLKRNLAPPGGVNAPPFLVNLAGISRHIHSMSAAFGEQALQKRFELYKRLQEAFERLHEKPELLEDLQAFDLIRAGQRILDESGKCPLCGAEHPAGYLHNLFEEKLQSAREAKETQKTIQEARESFDLVHANVRALLNDLTSAVGKAGLVDAARLIEEWMRRAEALAAQAERDRENYTLSLTPHTYATLDMPPDFLHRLEEIYSDLEKKFPVSSLEQDAWDRLTRLEVHLENFQRAQDALQQAEQRFQIAQVIKIQHEASRKEVLDKLYAGVCARFAELYKDLHGSDEEGFCAQLIPDGGGVSFRVDFHGHGTNPPQALHSEGHQDSMGVCLFLALSEQLTQGKLDLVVLDDVVMSVDIDHRQQLGDMLVQKFPHRQFLITTHDRVWATQLRNAGLVSSKGIVKFHGWDFSSGPQLSEISDLWDLIGADLDKGDVNSAAARLRRGLEEFSSHACDSLEARVRFAMDGHWELGDLLPAALEQYRYWLKKAKSAANSWNQKELVARLDEREERLKRISAQRDLSQWMINPSVHYTDWAELAPAEFRRVVEAHRGMVDLFYCQTCGSLLSVSEEERSPAVVKCACGEINWNLREKGG